MMQKENILTVLQEYKRDYAEKYGILAIGVFGSVARGEAGESSDVDICIQTINPDPFNLVHIKEDLESRVHSHVDIIRVREKMNPDLREQIKRDAIYV